MRTILVALLVLAPAGCTQNKGRPGTLVHRVLQNSTVTTVNGVAFNVGIDASRRFAIVGAVRGRPKVTFRTLERAAEQVSGCRGTFAKGVLAFYEGDASKLRLPLKSPLRVNLDC